MMNRFDELISVPISEVIELLKEEAIDILRSINVNE